MSRGRKPKPTELKRLAGNPGKRPLGNEPQPPRPEGTPYAPRHLNDAAKKEWRRLVGILLEMGLYTVVDRAALAMYCQAWGRWVVAEKKVAEGEEMLKSEKGIFYQNPWRHEANRAYEQMRKMLAEFGLTPSSRTRLTALASESEPSLAEQLFAAVAMEAAVRD